MISAIPRKTLTVGFDFCKPTSLKNIPSQFLILFLFSFIIIIIIIIIWSFGGFSQNRYNEQLKVDSSEHIK